MKKSITAVLAAVSIGSAVFGADVKKSGSKPVKLIVYSPGNTSHNTYTNCRDGN